MRRSSTATSVQLPYSVSCLLRIWATSLSRAERLKNLTGVFAAGEHALPPDTPLILFDDIVTTGSTLDEAARALTRAGFTHITRLALAH